MLLLVGPVWGQSPLAKDAPAPAAPNALRIVFRTDPPEAMVYDGERALGLSGQEVGIDFPEGHTDNTEHVFRFEKPGYESATRVLRQYALRAGRVFPPPGQKPIQLKKIRSTWGWWVAGAALIALLWGAWTAWRAPKKLRTVEAIGENSSLGGYALTKRLGAGATFEVFLGIRLSGDEAEVAVKVLHAHGAKERARFARQARILAGLRHPGIARFLDWGQDREALFMVEELADGGNLRERMAGMKFPDFMKTFGEVAEAISHAHEQGVIHRDLKPENILLTADGAVKVSDFGLAALVEDEDGTRGVGTPLYMAPEIMAGGAATPASDQYALGVMAYQMLSGKPPHEGATVAEIMRRRGEAPAPLRGVSPQVQAVVMRMLAPEPSARFASVREAISSLRAAALQ
ncbi:MAG: hypothetical protein FJX76_26200 [Armatimonadetes bacterium]|nr:hypothetical protein [Armatimonadota bacterium]